MLMQIWLEPTFKKAYYAQFFYVLVSLSAVAFGSVAYNVSVSTKSMAWSPLF